MFKVKSKIQIILLAGLTLSFLASCNQNRNRSNKAQTVSPYSNVGQIGATQVCTDASQRIGSIYTQSSTQLMGTGESLEMNVKSFVSASMNPNDIGSMSNGDRDNTGVRIEGTIRVDGSRNVTSGSRMTIKIYDSYVGQYDASGKQITPFEIYFDQVVSGQVDANGRATVTFRDNYGQVTFEGTINQNLWSGTVTYVNSVSYDGSAPTRGTLGQFYIARCGVGL